MSAQIYALVAQDATELAKSGCELNSYFILLEAGTVTQEFTLHITGTRTSAV